MPTIADVAGMPMVGIKRYPELDKAADAAEVWLYTSDPEDFLLPDSQMIAASTVEEAVSWLEARHPAPDPALRRVMALAALTSIPWRERHRRSKLPARIVVLRGLYLKQAHRYLNRDDYALIERLAADYGPILVSREVLAPGYGKSAHDAARSGDGYSEFSLVVRDWISHPDVTTDDVVFAYEPKRAAAREKGIKTKEARLARESRLSSQKNFLSNMSALARNALVSAANKKLADELSSSRLKAVPAGFFVAVSISSVTIEHAVEIHRAVFRDRSYRQDGDFLSLLAWWRNWPADVSKKDVDPEQAAFLDRELKALKRVKPEPAPAGEKQPVEAAVDAA